MLKKFIIFRSYSKTNPTTTFSIQGLKIKNVDKVSRIEFNRPEKFNAITWDMYRGMIQALTDANSNKSTSLTLFTGNYLYE